MSRLFFEVLWFKKFFKNKIFTMGNSLYDYLWRKSLI